MTRNKKSEEDKSDKVHVGTENSETYLLSEFSNVNVCRFGAFIHSLN